MLKTKKEIKKVNKEPFIDNTMENKIFIEKELKFISKFNFAEGKLEKDLLLIRLRELIREHLRNQEQLFQDALKKLEEEIKKGLHKLKGKSFERNIGEYDKMVSCWDVEELIKSKLKEIK